MNHRAEITYRPGSGFAREPSLSPTQLLDAATDLLLQGLDFLFQLDDRTYSRVAPPPYNASIGSHFRRVLEHLECLVKGFRPGEIDYDTPERTARLERDVAYASLATHDILRALRRFTKNMLSRHSAVICSAEHSGGGSARGDSTLGHELQYCIGHALHHFDIIRLICDRLSIRVPDEVGDSGDARKLLTGLVAQ